jgi:rhodanese-related sulfurtransferase
MLEESTADCSNKLISRNAKYKILTPDDFDAMMHKTNNVLLLDVRPADEFNNQSKLSYRNAGHIRNAVNIPAAEIDQKAASLADKSKPIIVHHFSGGSSDSYMVAKKLTDMGYQNVYVLSGGVFGLRWRAANIKGKSHLKDYVVDVPADNL